MLSLQLMKIYINMRIEIYFILLFIKDCCKISTILLDFSTIFLDWSSRYVTS